MRGKVLLIGMLLIGFVFLSKGGLTYAVEDTGSSDEDFSYFFISYNGEEQEIAINENFLLTLTGWSSESKSSVNGTIQTNPDTSNQTKEIKLDVSNKLSEFSVSEEEGIYFRLSESDLFKVEEVKPQKVNEKITVMVQNKNGTSIEEVKMVDEKGTVIENQGLIYYSTNDKNQKVVITKEEYDSLNKVVDESVVVESSKDTSDVKMDGEKTTVTEDATITEDATVISEGTPKVSEESPDEVQQFSTFSVLSEPVTEFPSVNYSTHVQDIGWQKTVSDGKLSGTEGKAKRLEGIKISISNIKDLGVKYSTHVQGNGWLNFVSNGVVSGTEGEAKRLEAIKIQLTGAKAGNYDIYYRVHAQDHGWMKWVKNGNISGTAGEGKRLEAIQIKIVEKGKKLESEPTPVPKPVTPTTKGPVIYSTHVQDSGWLGYVENGALSGTSGEGKRLEAIKISLKNSPYPGNIIYSTHVQDLGWLKNVSNGAMSGTSGQGKRLEAIKIDLSGEIANYYDVQYRVHIQDNGWLKWVKNGEVAGTIGKGKRLEAIEIKLVKKTGMYVSSISLPVYRSYDELADYNEHLTFYNPEYTRYSVLGYGDTVTVLETKNYASKIVTQGGLVGWVHKDYLEKSLTDDLWLVKEARNLRSKPDQNSSNLGTVSSGAKVYLLDHKTTSGSVYTEWYYIQTESGQKGWIWGAATTSGNSGYNVIKYDFNQEGKVTNNVEIFTPLNTKTDATKDQINAFINSKTGNNDTLMTNMGQAYLTAQKESGLNAIYLLAHSGLETGWGSSAISRDKYNFYGIGAIDSKPAQGAFTFDSPEGGIIAGSIWIRDNYVVRAEDTDNKFPYYPQPTIDNMRNDNSWHQYASDESWAVKIGHFAKEFFNFITGK